MTDKTKPQLSQNEGIQPGEPVPEDKPLPEPTAAEVAKAQKEGVTEAIKEAAKKGYLTGANENYGEVYDPKSARFAGSRDVFRLEPWLDLDPDKLAERIAGDGQNPLSEAQIAGLIEVERSGKNRTDVVKVLCNRLGLKSPLEVSAAGPGYTRDTTALSKL